MEALPDSLGIGPDDESLPGAESLPDVEAASLPDAESLLESDESDPEVMSLVVPVPRKCPAEMIFLEIGRMIFRALAVPGIAIIALRQSVQLS